MPYWQIYHPPGTFQDAASKAALARDATANYTYYGLPAFYVVVHFIETKEKDIYVGGEIAHTRGAPFIRIVIAHIHVKLPEIDRAYARSTSRIDAVLKPYIADKGYHWEYHIDETERQLWKINGLAPPPWKSEDEKVWAKENRPVSPKEMEVARSRL